MNPKLRSQLFQLLVGTLFCIGGLVFLFHSHPLLAEFAQATIGIILLLLAYFVFADFIYD